MKIYEWIATFRFVLQRKYHSAVGKNRNTGNFFPVSSELFLVKGFSAFCYGHEEHYAYTHKERSTGGVYPDALLYALLSCKAIYGK